MSWARYDDMLPMNKKIARLRAQGINGLAALGLHVLVNTWSRHEGAGGDIPAYIVEQLGGRHGSKLAAILHECGMFEECSDGWHIHDYEQYGERGQAEKASAERRAELSEKRAAAGRLGGSKQKATRRANTQASSQANGHQTPSPEPEPEPCFTSLQQQQPRERPAELAAAAAETFALIVDTREHQQWSRIGDHQAWRRQMHLDVPVEYDETVWKLLLANPGATPREIAEACGLDALDVARALAGRTP